MEQLQKGLEIDFQEAECYKIDTENNKVYCRSSQDTNLSGQEEFSVDYDYLVIAMGAKSNTFNTPGVVENCHFLKVSDGATFTLISLSILKENYLEPRVTKLRFRKWKMHRRFVGL